MPIYEFECRRCQRRFETLVFSSTEVTCPGCAGDDLERRFSAFAVGGGSGAEAEMPAGCGSCGDPRGPGACRLPD